ncbi:MAG: glycoside hydrolase family 18 protein [Gammaproteobacteria bacterium]|nr:glycoside hydrolase family 18 protein [Gammaproteobacteria bacterium]
MNPWKSCPSVLAALSAMLLLVGSWAPAAVGATLYQINVAISPTDTGSVTLDPYKPLGYAKNNIVTLTAVPASDYVFDKWSGAVSGTTNPITLRVSGTANVTAMFKSNSGGGGGGGGGTARPALPASHLIVGYFAQWDIYQRNYLIRNVDQSGAAAAMDVMNYAFAAPDANLKCASLDTFADYGKAFGASESVDGVADTYSQPVKGNFNQILKLKARYPHLRVLLSLGGWTESYRFSDAALPENRAAFVRSCIDLFMRDRFAGVFDGFDIDWEYPGSCGNTCDFRPEDRQNYIELLKEFRTQLNALSVASPDKPRYLLTVAAPAGSAKYGVMDLAAMHEWLDWINIMAYDFHGTWEPTGPTNHAAALRQSTCEPESGDWGDKAVQAYRDEGVPVNKLLLGVPFYGHGWRGVTASDYGFCGLASGLARGVYERGTNDYKVLKAQKRPEFFDQRTATHWSFNGSEFWSFDDVDTMEWKAIYVNEPGRALRGMMFWELSGDAADGTLVKAMRDELGERVLPPTP